MFGLHLSRFVLNHVCNPFMLYGIFHPFSCSDCAAFDLVLYVLFVSVP